MKKPDPAHLTLPLHQLLFEKDEREWYAANPHDYYAVNYRHRIGAIIAAVTAMGAKRAVEFGCAQGTIALQLAERNIVTVAADINCCMLTYSAMKYERGPLSWVASNANAPPFRPGTFDCVILAEILEHCADPLELLEPAFELLRSGGRVVITTPNGDSVNNRLPTYSQAQTNREAIVKRQFGPDGDDHLFAFTSRELKSLVKKAGFAIERSAALGNHFLQWKSLYHVRHALPWFWNTALEAAVPALPGLRLRFTHCLFVVGRKAP